MNICGDSFCRDCWVGHIQEHLNTMNPFMRCMNCRVPLLYETIENILEDNKKP